MHSLKRASQESLYVHIPKVEGRGGRSRNRIDRMRIRDRISFDFVRPLCVPYISCASVRAESAMVSDQCQAG